MYGDATGFKAYHDERGNSYTNDDVLIAQALFRSSEYLDQKYAPRFPGERTNRRDQVREWPRAAVVNGDWVLDADGELIDPDEIPSEMITATYEVALRELATPGVMRPDMRASEGRKSVAVSGAVSVTYGRSDLEARRLTVIAEGTILRRLLTNKSYLGGNVGMAYRG